MAMISSFHKSPPLCCIYASVNRVSIGSDNGLWPFRRQAIILTNTGLLSIGPLWTKFSEIWIKMQDFLFMKMHLKMWSAKRRLFCSGEDELTYKWRRIACHCLWIKIRNFSFKKMHFKMASSNLVLFCPNLNKWTQSYLCIVSALQWRHNGHDGFSNHQPYDCLLNRLFRRSSKKN